MRNQSLLAVLVASVLTGLPSAGLHAEETKGTQSEDAKAAARKKEAEDVAAAKAAIDARNADTERTADADQASEETRIAAEIRRAKEAKAAEDAKVAEAAKQAAEVQLAVLARVERARTTADEGAGRLKRAAQSVGGTGFDASLREAADVSARLADGERTAKESNLTVLARAAAQTKRVSDATGARADRAAAVARLAEEKAARAAQLAKVASRKSAQASEVVSATETGEAISGERTTTERSGSLKGSARTTLDGDTHAASAAAQGEAQDAETIKKAKVTDNQEAVKEVRGAKIRAMSLAEDAKALQEDAAEAKALARVVQERADQAATAAREADKAYTDETARITKTAQQAEADAVRVGELATAAEQAVARIADDAKAAAKAQADAAARQAAEAARVAALQQAFDAAMTDYAKAKTQDDLKAVKAALEKLSAQGVDVATVQLGVMRVNAEGSERDVPGALQLFEAAAKAGNHDAAFYAAVIYDKGKGGVTRNAENATAWCSKAVSGADKTITEFGVKAKQKMPWLYLP